MELTKETFDDFVSRLKFHNKGDGVNDHCTANPIFIVQKKELVTGIDPDFCCDDYFWTDDDGEAEWTDSDLQFEINEAKKAGVCFTPYDIEEDHEIKDEDGEVLYRRIYYVVRWDYVSAHLTREAAEAFIKRKGHDYRQLRVWVDSQHHCWEFNAIIKGLLNGQIVYDLAKPGADMTVSMEVSQS